MLSRFKEFLEKAATEADQLFNRVKDRSTFKRVVQASYLIAIADGDFSSEEKQALARLIQDKMPHFTVSDIMGVLDDCEKNVAFDETFGKQEIMNDVCKASGDEPDLIIRTACFIGASDGDFDDNEKAVVRELCKRWDVRAEGYGL